MEKRAKAPTVFGLWEVKFILASLAVMVAAVFAAHVVIRAQAEERAEQESIEQAEQESLKAEQESIEAEERAARHASEEAAEAARIAAGPITVSTNDDGQEIYTVDYSLGDLSIEFDENGGADYSEILELSEYGAYNGNGDFDFIYPTTLYAECTAEDKGAHMDTDYVITFSAMDGSLLVAEYMTTSLSDSSEVLSNLCERTGTAYGVAPETEAEEIDSGTGRLIWKSSDSETLAKGIICTSGGKAWQLTVICPAALDGEDAQYKEYYMESMINLCGFSEGDAETLTWDAWSRQQEGGSDR